MYVSEQKRILTVCKEEALSDELKARGEVCSLLYHCACMCFYRKETLPFVLASLSFFPMLLPLAQLCVVFKLLCVCMCS